MPTFPDIAPDADDARHILAVNRCGEPVGWRSIRERSAPHPCLDGCLAPGSSPHYHLNTVGWQLIGTTGIVDVDLDMEPQSVSTIRPFPDHDTTTRSTA